MSNLVDITKLKTVQSMSHELGCSVQTIYNKIKRGDIKCIEIDGVKFCIVND